MAKKSAGRREQRIAKRQVAKETRSTKYKNQKGGAITKQQGKLGKVRTTGADHEEDDGEDMAVVRGGKAIWSRSTEPDPNAQPDPESDVEDQRFSSVEKKLRALKKKMRKLQMLKQRRKKGFELEQNQMMLLRTEATLATQISVFEEEGASAQQAQEEEDDDDDDEGAGATDMSMSERRETLQGLGIEERRQLKKQRHLQKMEAKRQKREAKRK